MNTERVMEVLREVEWGQGYDYCPWCHWASTRGHRDDCELAALLSEGEKEEAPRYAKC